MGVVIDQYSLDARTGNLSIVGSSGKLVVHTNEDVYREITPDQFVTAFKLEGLTIKDSKTTSSQSTFLKGSGGKPISGSKNSGTTITNSTIKSATSVDPPFIIIDDLDLVEGSDIGANTENNKNLENKF